MRIQLLSITRFSPALLVLLVVMSHSHSAVYAAGQVPWQFIARMYTESLGRLPDQSGWENYVNWFSSNGCSEKNLKLKGREFYTGPEYNLINYDNAAKILSLYRGVLRREPDRSGFDHYYQQLQSGTSWVSVVDNVLSSPEFASLTSLICSNNPYYWYTGNAPINIPTSSTGNFAGGTGAQLQGILNNVPYGSTVYLEQKAVVRIDSTLYIPPGVTLKTVGDLSPNRYAMMARLVRNQGFQGPVIQLEASSALSGIWVEGRVASFTRQPDNYNARVVGGSTYIGRSRFSDSSGGGNIFASSNAYESCPGSIFENNLFTGYANDRTSKYTDGIGTECDSTTIRNNEFVDLTDVSIVVFRTKYGTTNQSTQVYSNKILNAGNSASGAINLDPLNVPNEQPTFTNASIRDNQIWTSRSPAVGISIGLGVGTRAWFGSAARTGMNGSVTNNTSGSQVIQGSTGVLISGMTNVTVTGNTLTWIAGPGPRCPRVSVAKSNNPQHASGNIQSATPFPDSNIDGCIGR